MIAGQFHQGSGLGNQLHRYIMTRVLAMDKSLDWGMYNPGFFKGHSIFNLDMGMPVEDIEHEYIEKIERNTHGVDVRGYDWDGLLSIGDNTIIDGEFQGEDYYAHHRDKIDSWLQVEPIDIPDRMCIINFRGGEYVGFPDLFLTQKYWDDAIAHMRTVCPNVIFRVVTDDVENARLFFPDFDIRHDIALDWRYIRCARYLILSNSSFAILPAWLNEDAYVIAPKYWARHNVSDGYWALEQNKYKTWNYLDRNGIISRV